jgi:DNA-binding SARP family transcriptional activator
MLSIGVLGPLEVFTGGRAVTVSAPRLRTLLAALALSPDRAVPVSRLATAVWDEDPPADARRAVQLYVTRLRRLLGPSAIETSQAGYRLRVDPSRVDALRMVSLLDAAAAGPASEERALLVSAAGLWRGAPFEGLRSGWLAGVAETLTERHLAGLERRIALDLDAGAAGLGELVAELRLLVARHPLRERMWGQLMVALYRSGRQGDALAAYAQVRGLLDAELGVSPGPELRDVHRKLLLADPALAAGVPVPRQLPAAVADFVGRASEVEVLDTLVASSGPSAAVIVGAAGIGKTALALWWAHRSASHFPDGQLFVSLDDVTPADALGAFLSALGVPNPPQSEPARAALFRSLTAEKRMLVVVDNARSADQARPLLPGGPLCRAVITSRDLLAGLVAAGATAVVLDSLPDADARRLLVARLGASRVAREAAAVDEIVALCGGLPLSLVTVAARSATQPRVPLVALAAGLRPSSFRGARPPFPWAWGADGAVASDCEGWRGALTVLDCACQAHGDGLRPVA